MDQPNGKQITYTVANLDCAACAARMQDQISALPDVTEASLDFATARLRIRISRDVVPESLTGEISQIVRQVEKDARLIDTEKQSVTSGPDERLEHDATDRSGPDHIRMRFDHLDRLLMVRLAIGAVLFILALMSRTDGWLRPVLSGAAYLLLAYDVLLAAVRRIWQRQWFDEHFLMGLATIGALVIGEYPEAVAVMLFYQTGELFQRLAVDHSRRSIRSLLSMTPETALLLTGQGTEQVRTATVQPGSRLLIRPGDRVALDCRILDGHSDMDTAALTGESQPRPAGPGTELMAGFINGSGLLTAVVLRPMAESAISRVLRLVEDAAARKAPAEQFITRFAAVYTPVMVGLALLLALVPPLVAGQPFSPWIYRALILLVISCPCALVLSIPLSYFAGLGAASSRGILVKGGQFLDRLALIRTIAWDKTGTLTQGRFSLVDLAAVAPATPDDVLTWAALAEHGSSHPIARSIKQAYLKAHAQPVDPQRVQDSHELAGTGIRARIDGRMILLGSEQLMRSNQIDMTRQDLPDQAVYGTSLYLAADGQLAGRLILADTVRPETAEAIRLLRGLKVSRHVMLSGDHEAAAAVIAEASGMDSYQAGLLPHDKVAALEALLQDPDNGYVAYVGDGINDAPVLARADLSIAMGHGSDAALERADLVIVGNDLTRISEAVHIGRMTRSVARQNILLAIGLKGLIVLLAMAGLGGIWQAVFADVGVALLAVFNALRILPLGRLPGKAKKTGR